MNLFFEEANIMKKAFEFEKKGVKSKKKKTNNLIRTKIDVYIKKKFDLKPIFFRSVKMATVQN